LVASGATMALSGTPGRTLSARILLSKALPRGSKPVGGFKRASNLSHRDRRNAQVAGDATLSSSGRPPPPSLMRAPSFATRSGTFTIALPAHKPPVGGAQRHLTVHFHLSATNGRRAWRARILHQHLPRCSRCILTGSGRSTRGPQLRIRCDPPLRLDTVIAPGGWTNASGGVIEVELRGKTPVTEYDQLLRQVGLL